MTLTWILGLTNTYEALDKVDGLAASGTVIASAFLAFIAYQHGSAFTYLCALTLFAASVGFLVFNWPPARIPLGAVGSASLGFSFAVMAIIAGLYDHSHTSLFVVPLLLFHFIFDAIFTFVVRGRWEQDQPGQARLFLYQLLTRSGYSHRKVVLIHSGMGICQGFGAILMINMGNNRMWIFLPFLLFQAGYAYWLLRMPNRRNLAIS